MPDTVPQLKCPIPQETNALIKVFCVLRKPIVFYCFIHDPYHLFNMSVKRQPLSLQLTVGGELSVFFLHLFTVC